MLRRRRDNRVCLPALALALAIAAALLPLRAGAEVFGAALRFTDFDQAATVPSFDTATTGSMTVEFRLRIDERPLEPIFGMQDPRGVTSLVGDYMPGGTHSFYIGLAPLEADLYLNFFTTSSSPINTLAAPKGALTIGRWNHVAVTIGSGQALIYLNGQQVGSLPYSGVLLESTNPLSIGPKNVFALEPDRFTIDELRIWKTVRTADELVEQMYLPIPAGSPLLADMIGYWQFDEEVGPVAANLADATQPALIGQESVWAEKEFCPEDIDGGGMVDGTELALMGNIFAFGSCLTSAFCPGDVNGDLSVDEGDLVAMAAAYGQNDCATRYVPVIIEAMVAETPFSQPIAEGFTGLPFDTCVEPYIAGVTGQQLISADVNKGIGGSTTGIWTNYASVPNSWAGPVLVDWEAQHWPGSNWDSSRCRGEWQVASGTSQGRPGALTTGTGDFFDPCSRIGLCVRYAPIGESDGFISNTALTEFGSCPAFCESNGVNWPMEQDPLDIHTDCGDSRFVYLCENRAADLPPRPDDLFLNDTQKLALLEAHAPRIWIESTEEYMPSSVDWSFENYDSGPLVGQPKMERYLNPDGRYWIRAFEPLDSPSDWNEYHNGPPEIAVTNPARVPVQDVVPVYAYWTEKPITLPGGIPSKIVDLVYFMYYPYNRGKGITILGQETIYGNHVGDWEHLTVRLEMQYDELSGWVLAPRQVFIAAHDFGGAYDWHEPLLQKVGTHPVAYAAWGSHGLWIDPGDHIYQTIPVINQDLVDETDAGEPWDTWQNVIALDFNAQAGLGGASWPIWMDDNFSDPGCGTPAPHDPTDCGPIYRWGNVEDTTGSVAGQNRLENGPTGPVSKGVMTSVPLQ